MPHNPLIYWSLAQLLADPQRSVDSLIDDFCHAYYGPAATSLAMFHHRLEAAAWADGNSSWSPRMYPDVAQPSPAVFTADLVQQLDADLATAESLDLPAIYASRVASLRHAFEHTRTHVNAHHLTGLDADKPWRLERHANHYVINADGPDVDAARYDDLIRHALDTGQYTPQLQTTVFRAQKRHTPVVHLNSEYLELAVVPEIGGRAVRLIDRITGWNALMEQPTNDRVQTIGQTYINYGGYEEYLGKAFPGPGWELPFTVVSPDGPADRTLTLEATHDNYRWLRTYQLAADGPELLVRSTLTNMDARPRSIMLRTHPLLQLGPDVGQSILHLRQPDGSYRESRVDREHDGLSFQPHGVWAVQHPTTNRAIVKRFDPAHASGYVFLEDGKRFLQMELFGNIKSLAPGESLTLSQTIRLVTSAETALPAILAAAKPLSDSQHATPSGNKAAKAGTTPHASGHPSPLNPAAVTAQNPQILGSGTPGAPKAESLAPVASSPPASTPAPPAPAADQPAPTPGRVGNAGRFSAATHLSLQGKVIDRRAGSLAFWVRFNQPLHDVKDAFLLSIGDNNPDWFTLGFSRGQVFWLNKVGRPPYTNPGDSYLNLTAELPRKAPGDWTHVTIVWAIHEAPGRSMMHLYLDGRLAAERNDLTLTGQFDFERNRLTFCRSTANRRLFAEADLDEIVISRRPQNAAWVGRLASISESLPVDEDTLSQVTFDGPPQPAKAPVFLDQPAINAAVEAR